MEDNLSKVGYEKERDFLKILNHSVELYFSHGTRCSKRVDIIHIYIKNELEAILGDDYIVKTEFNVAAINSSGKKKCDIVVLLKENYKIILIFPVKFIMGNYNQNKNNYYENLTGELCHLKWANGDVKICPINIILNTIPYKNNKNKVIKKEQIAYETSFKIYENLVSKQLCDFILNYIVVNEEIEVGKEFISNSIKHFHSSTKFIPFEIVIEKLNIKN